MHFIQKLQTIPTILDSPEIQRAKKELAAFYKNFRAGKTGQKKAPFPSLSADTIKELNRILMDAFQGRCAYCETAVIPGDVGCFDHFRPVRGARGLKNEYAPQHYSWLYFDWENMYLVCPDCNSYKSNWFPVAKSRCVIGATWKKILSTEQAQLVDPCHDVDAGYEFYYSETGEMGSSSRRGQLTIEVLKLNRVTLVEGRRNATASFRSLMKRFDKLWHAKVVDPQEANDVVGALQEYVIAVLDSTSRSPFVTIRGAVLNGWINGYSATSKELKYYFVEGRRPRRVDPALFKIIEERGKQLCAIIRDVFGTDARRTLMKNVEYLHEYGKSDTLEIYIEKITIRNFKGIRDLSIDFPPFSGQKESWLMLLGENGVGKSCFLKAVALTLMGNEQLERLKIRAKDVLTYGQTKGFVEIYVTGKVELKNKNRELIEPIVLDLNSDAAWVVSNLKTPGTFLFGYGSTRLFPSKTVKAPVTRGMTRTANLFDPFSAMRDGKKWLIRIKKRSSALFQRVCIALKDLLLLGEHDKIVVIGSSVYIDYYEPGTGKHGRRENLDWLSDGYKSIIAIGLDIMAALQQANTPFERANGIVLLDEIGTHLHPRWKMEVVKKMRRAFPGLQFIVTTHDPLCLRGLQKGEVVVLEKDEQGSISMLQNLPDPSELRVDQLLSSEFFGLKSAIDPAVEKTFNEYYNLLRKKERLDPAARSRMEQLQKELRDSRHLGNSLREELAFEAADQVLAEEEVALNKKGREELKASTVQLLKTLWANISTPEKP